MDDESNTVLLMHYLISTLRSHLLYLQLASSATSDHRNHMKPKLKSVASEPRTSDITVAWERAKKRLAKMNKDEIQQTFVDAGILTKKGNLTKPYRGVFVKAKN